MLMNVRKILSTIAVQMQIVLTPKDHFIVIVLLASQEMVSLAQVCAKYYFFCFLLQLIIYRH